MKAVASAKKTKFGYKPVIKYPNGSARKSEVVEQSIERQDVYTKHGRIEGDKYARGSVYETRQEAINACQEVINSRLEETLIRYKKFGCPQKMEKEIIMWGGKI